MTTLVVVYDSACGDCSAIAARLSTVLDVTVRTRSCRDPNLAAEFPVLVTERPCRRPLTLTIAPDGTTKVASGLGMLLRAARFIKPGQLWAACRVAGWYLRKAR